MRLRMSGVSLGPRAPVWGQAYLGHSSKGGGVGVAGMAGVAGWRGGGGCSQTV